MPSVHRKLTVIVSADVVGYSALMERDEAGTLARLKANRTAIFDPRVSALKSLWRSDKLDGRVLDIVLEDPKTGARGLTALTVSADGKGTSLTFFQLD